MAGHLWLSLGLRNVQHNDALSQKNDILWVHMKIFGVNKYGSEVYCVGKGATRRNRRNHRDIPMGGMAGPLSFQKLEKIHDFFRIHILSADLRNK